MCACHGWEGSWEHSGLWLLPLQVPWLRVHSRCCMVCTGCMKLAHLLLQMRHHSCTADPLRLSNAHSHPQPVGRTVPHTTVTSGRHTISNPQSSSASLCKGCRNCGFPPGSAGAKKVATMVVSGCTLPSQFSPAHCPTAFLQSQDNTETCTGKLFPPRGEDKRRRRGRSEFG